MRSLVLHHFATYFVVLVLSALAFNGLIMLDVLRLHAKTLAAQQTRQDSLQVTQDIEQETSALSKMVRAYTTSANTKYLTYYYDIIDIRQGVKASPEGYDTTYWAKVMAGERKHLMAKDRAGVSLLKRMETHGFSPEEFDSVDEVLRYSNLLYQQDQIAFAATQGLYDPEQGIFVDDGKPQLQFANEFVYSDHYLQMESRLIQEVRGFAQLTDERTRAAVRAVSIQLRRSIFAAMVSLAITVAIVLVAMVVIRRMVLAPMKSLMDSALQLGKGDYSKRADTGGGVHELQALGQTFNGMAQNIQEDIQHRQQIQSALEVATLRAEESTKAKSLFLANMSHEIRTPMNAIIGMTYLALNTNLDERQQDYIGKIKEAAQSLLGIINDILDFSKIEAGKLHLDHIAFRLEDVVSNTLTLLRQRTVEKGLELLLDIKNPQLLDDSGTFLGDPLRLGQVLTNLLTNAVKFTNHGYVRISIEEQPHQGNRSELQFCVEDTGIGMTPAQMTQLFQEFSQVDGTTTRKQGGTGLGLSISKRLVTGMGGEMIVTSQLHKGSQFSCVIPFDKPDRIEAAPFEVPRHGLRVLIVDDCEPARTVLRSLLGHFRVESVEVDSGEAALDLLSRSAEFFDFVFIDWVMPGMGGEELILAIRRLALHPQPELVVVSAYDLEQIHLLCGQQQLCRFLPKPVLPTELRKLFGQIALSPRLDENTPVWAGFGDLEGMRVLLAEDNPFNQQVATELLALKGVAVELANNGQEAVAIISAHPERYYQAVLMDIQMPVMDGYEATRILRSQSQYASLPIIAMTAHVMAEEQQRCLAVGMNGHLAKPVDPAILFRTLARYYPRSGQVGQAVQPPAAAPRPLPAKKQDLMPSTIPGIDWTVGLRFCGNQPERYCTILKGFASDYDQVASTLQQLLDQAEWNEIFEILHAFKGLAGMIGAQGLQALSGQAEQEAKAHSPRLAMTIMELNDQLSALIKAIDSFFAVEEGLPAESMPPAGPGRDATLLFAQLRQLLSESDSAAQDFWRDHETALKERLPVAAADALARSIATFQFQGALAQLPRED